MKKLLFAAALLLTACGSSENKSGGNSAGDTFAKGADIGWLTEMEANGRKFYTPQGVEKEGMALLKSLGMNSVRLRVWVDPSAIGGWCGKQDVLAKALRAKELGMRIMIDFHYSDWWADPGKQNKPAAWVDLDLEGLKAAVAAHTVEVLTLLKDNGVEPEWVQVGNETTNGMLWETGRASEHMDNYAALSNAGYDAVKSVFPKAQVIVHIDNGYDNALYKWLFGGLRQLGGKWDIIGMSLYPTYRTKDGQPVTWQTTNTDCMANLADMIATYNTPVMICEVGMPWDQAGQCKAWLTDLITKARSVPDGKCLGVFYWEPISNPAWAHGYTLGAFDAAGKPTVALDAFAN